jgi:hypothetical protein
VNSRVGSVNVPERIAISVDALNWSVSPMSSLNRVIPRSVREKILAYKKRRATKKRLRRKPDIEE